MAGKLESDALMEEYKTLRTEIAQRVQSQFVITGANLAFLSAVLVKLPDWANADHVNLLLALPLVTPVIAWLYFEQDVFVTQAASYLHNKLRPAVMRRVASEASNTPVEPVEELMGWEDYRNELLFSRPRDRRFMMMLVVFRLLANTGPGVAMLLVGGYVLHATAARLCAVTALQWVLIAADGLAIGFSVSQYASVFRRYLRIAKPASP